MKMSYKFLIISSLIVASCLLQSCARRGDDVWEDTKSAGRHMQRGMRALGGKHGDSRQVRSRNDFECVEDDGMYQDGGFHDCSYEDNSYQRSDYYSVQDSAAQEGEFIALKDQESEDIAMLDGVAIQQPRETPGEQGSSIPGIQSFRDPNTIPQTAGIFRPIYFEYNSNLIKGSQNLQTIHTIADYLRRRPALYVFIEGHTDERGPQAYNLALGARRANAVRNLLISEGVNPNNLFTISYGKERPVVLEHHEEGWSRNRRAEFKIYER